MEEDAWASKRDGSRSRARSFRPAISLTANVRAAMTTGNAIFLSALTTIVGFSVLTWHSLVPIEPMRTVGNTPYWNLDHIHNFDAHGSCMDRTLIQERDSDGLLSSE